MKLSTYALSKFNSLLSYIDAVKSFGKMDALAHEANGVSQFDLNSGSSKCQHGSFGGLPNSKLNANSTDHQDAFTDAIHEAPNAYVTNYEANQYLKSILKVEMTTINKSIIVNADRDAYHCAYYANKEQPWKKVTNYKSIKHVQVEPRRPSVEGSRGDQNYRTEPGLYRASLKKKIYRSVPSPIGPGLSTLITTLSENGSKKQLKLDLTFN
jgi:hypothetical protein